MKSTSGKDCKTCVKCMMYIPCVKKGNKNAAALLAGDRKEIDHDAAETMDVTKKSKGSCFPARATMRGEDGKPIKMSDLAVGAQVYASGSVEPVTNFIHHDHDEEETFLRLITEKGTLELSPNHLVFVKAADGSRSSVFANAVHTDDMLMHRDGHATVAAIETFKSRGIYAPLTRSGEVEVNGFHTSCYASFPSHEAAHAVMLPLHYLPANSGGVHWYARGWQRMYEGAQWILSKF